MITVILDKDTDVWEVWTDTESGIRDGRCLGLGDSKGEALWEALSELTKDHSKLLELVREHSCVTITKGGN